MSHPPPSSLAWQWGAGGGVQLEQRPALAPPCPQCFGLVCWAASARPRRPATRCVCSSSTKTARHCRPSSTCGHRAAAPALHWPSTESTCWLPSASSVPTALRTGCCSPTLAMPGPGAPRRTAVYAWPPDVALPEPRDKPPPPATTHRRKDVPDQARTQPISSLALASRKLSDISHLRLCDSPSHTLRRLCTWSDPLSQAAEDTLNGLF